MDFTNAVSGDVQRSKYDKKRMLPLYYAKLFCLGWRRLGTGVEYRFPMEEANKTYVQVGYNQVQGLKG